MKDQTNIASIKVFVLSFRASHKQPQYETTHESGNSNGVLPAAENVRAFLVDLTNATIMTLLCTCHSTFHLGRNYLAWGLR